MFYGSNLLATSFAKLLKIGPPPIDNLVLVWYTNSGHSTKLEKEGGDTKWQ